MVTEDTVRLYGISVTKKIEEQHLERPPVDITIKPEANGTFFC